jgi:hypothetical protein
VLPRHALAGVRSAGHDARVLLVAFGLLLLSGCNVELFGEPIWVSPTQHPVGHLLVFVVAMVIVVLFVGAIVDLVELSGRSRSEAEHDGDFV